eukprot:1347407-Amorphochlora_amoeboformis.AAC.3
MTRDSQPISSSIPSERENARITPQALLPPPHLKIFTASEKLRNRQIERRESGGRKRIGSIISRGRR